ncbi:aspartate dehydrogenase [Antarcticimicrobium luteum]|uniref:L-aspartate dehydrogenase n=1 Tax=Antarcticimicrobium luteum TaxID=2547397 RepID=A0A4R5VFJ3_9RHOB|nr:aspartate dehydrogenase [Antarcticimicrobium luteum]TDK51373.1 aspartate dehydrogenase [Antarcticimicrobium luteum]
MKIALIGDGAIAGYVRAAMARQDLPLAAIVLRPERLAGAGRPAGVPAVASVADLPGEVTHVVDCAGHEGLRQHGAAALRRGLDVITVSAGALADRDLRDSLREAAAAGDSRLHVASGAIGALDALRAARQGRLEQVRYVGRKPPLGWRGSMAEEVLNLADLGGNPQVHFRGDAGTAALRYPKNANVAAAVALAGIGFDATQVELVADPTVGGNVHEVHACGDFGSFSFSISGNPLPDNPRSSALAAMSIVAALRGARDTIVI